MKASNQKCENQSTDDKPNEWKNIPWHKLERKVYKLQKRIYTASERGETLKGRKLQKLMIKSRAAKLLAVRRVTQENKGKKTAGVDGVKALSPRQRLELAKNLRIDGKAMPTPRVWIDKPGRDEKRPLGIPVMRDRAKQKLVELALDPEWEARFEPNSYGFRKGRSCPDAIDAINSSIQKMPKWVLDADIAKCFDRINHEALLTKLNTMPHLLRQIKAWLRCGVLDGMKYFDTIEGTPQGGVISPLLANVALHGMENLINQVFGGGYYISPQGKRKRYTSNTVRLIRYADDFVILAR
jgi:RNA-directed DNA polymerase